MPCDACSITFGNADYAKYISTIEGTLYLELFGIAQGLQLYHLDYFITWNNCGMINVDRVHHDATNTLNHNAFLLKYQCNINNIITINEVPEDHM